MQNEKALKRSSPLKVCDRLSKARGSMETGLNEILWRPPKEGNGAKDKQPRHRTGTRYFYVRAPQHYGNFFQHTVLESLLYAPKGTGVLIPEKKYLKQLHELIR